jgi:O-methyltransferase involved in polyketide biosynthesis
MREPEKPYDPTKPNVARIYDFLLGGKDNFDVDRKAAAKLLEVYPRAAELAAMNRRFQARAVAEVARLGVAQFIDVGAGLPTVLNTHDAARSVRPEARVIYVDNDPVVLTHARALLATDGILALAGDLQYPNEILSHPDVLRLIDFTQPVAIILGMALHFFPADQARRIMKEFISGVGPGSYIIISLTRGDEEVGERVARAYTAETVYNHSVDTVRGFLGDLELMDPGLTEARYWKTIGGSNDTEEQPGQVWVAVGKKVTT